MPRLPAVSGREAVAAFQKAGFVAVRRRGRHIAMTKAGHPHTLSIPDDREVRTGILRTLIRQAGLTVDEFVELLR